MKNKVPFAQRHPKLYTLISFLIVILLLAIALFALYWFFIWIGILINMFIDWTKATFSKTDSVVVVALISGSVSIIGIVISSIVAKTIDYKKARREYLAQKREQPYGEFIEMYFRISNQKRIPYPEKEMIDDMNSFSKQLILYGSEHVVKKWVEFRKNGADSNKAEDNIFVLEKIMNYMRKDIGVKKLKEGQLLSLNVNDIDEVLKKRKKK